MRQPADVFPRSVEVVAVADLTRPVEWRPLLRDVETVVHLAGIAHAGSQIAERADTDTDFRDTEIRYRVL